MVERVEQRREGAERPEPEAQRDDAQVLDAVVGEQPLDVVLKDDEARRDEDRQRPKKISSRRRQPAPAARSTSGT